MPNTKRYLTTGGVGFAVGTFFLWNYPNLGLGAALLGGLVIAALCLLYSAPLPDMIKAGLIAGMFGAVMTIVYGTHKPGVAIIAGMLSGLGAGLLAFQRSPQANPKKAAILGAEAGAIAGAWTGLALFVMAFVIAPAAGISAGDFAEHLSETVILADTLGLGSDILILLFAFGFSTLTGALLGAAACAARSLPLRPNIPLLAVIALPVLLIPLIDRAGNLLLLDALIPIYIFILLALGLNIVVGYAGLLDLGYAAFFAIGAYTTAMLSSPHLGINLSFWLVIWVAAAVAAIAGLTLGAPTLPLRGDYLAIVTLGFGEIVPILFRSLGGGPPGGTLTLRFFGMPIGIEQVDLTGGNKGINPISPPHLPLIGDFEPSNKIPWYYLLIVIMGLAIFFINRLRDSRQGRAWMAMREDELAADAMGINVVRTKLLAFSMGAMFSGFGGAFYGAFIGAIFPSSFDFSVSIILLCMVILGGLGNMTGVIVGGLLIQGADKMFIPKGAELFRRIAETKARAEDTSTVGVSALQDLTQQRLLLFGIVLVVMMLVRPEGLLPNERRKAELHPDDDTINSNSVAAEAEADPSLAA
ncbi:branched-chain amino acid ABC transporter permease [Herpetosiphon geysericola]|nr:branched-chain amino acid ABC transporter permease [Herpetosiphon geysericola]